MYESFIKLIPTVATFLALGIFYIGRMHQGAGNKERGFLYQMFAGNISMMTLLALWIKHA